MIVNQWEMCQGTGKALDLDTLITHLQDIRAKFGVIPCRLRNYEEENTIAPITDIIVDDGCIVFESLDPGTLTYKGLS